MFFSHSGISNQLIGLERAAYLAFATNRTLFLPPVLPRVTAVADDLKYPKITAKAAGSGCGHMQVTRSVFHMYTHTLSWQLPVQFPFYKALFDVYDIFHETGGLKVIDMPEFARTRTVRQGFFRIQTLTWYRLFTLVHW